MTTQQAHPSATRTIDASVHPMPHNSNELAKFMPRAWRNNQLPDLRQQEYISSQSDYSAYASRDDGLPGSDVDRAVDWIFNQSGSDLAILLPLTRGMLPNNVLTSVICTATNEWVADTWMSADVRFRMSVRVNPGDPKRAVAEIRRWAGDDRVAQIAVPTQSMHPYGHDSYRPVWEAAAEAGLPVALHADGGSTVGFHVTPVGPLRYAVEYHAMFATAFAFHLASLINEGVLSDLPSLRFVIADGGADYLMPLAWRMDNDWRGTRFTMPWAVKPPSEYAKDHLRFCLHSAELPSEAIDADTWFSVGDVHDLIMFASNYPYSNSVTAAEIRQQIGDDISSKVMGGTAAEMYLKKSRSEI